MKIKFSIHYATAWGESLHVLVTYKSHDGRTRTYNLPMVTEDGERWSVETAVRESRQHPVDAFEYVYQVENSDGEVLRREWNLIRREYVFDSTRDYELPDVWRDVPLCHHLYTKAFVTASGQQHKDKVDLRRLPLYRRTLVFRVSAPQLRPGEGVALCGSHPSLGDWSPSRFLPMEYLGDYEWILSVNVDNTMLPIEYKYVVTDLKTRQLKHWEEGENRVVDIKPGLLPEGQVRVLYGEALRVKEATWKIAGLVVPLFSLRSEHSCGVGDFGDLMRMAEWAAKAGMHMIQLLPINDTTCRHDWTDSHPYNAVSLFALHPHYMDLEQLPSLDNRQEMVTFNRQRRELNELAYSDYMAVDRVKSDYINKVAEQYGAACLASAEFQAFYAEQASWLLPYAVFCALRDRFGTARTADWKQYGQYDSEAVAELARPESPLYPAISRTWFVQYHLYKQLRKASDYAHKLGVALKGDLPAGIYRDSVETWMHPELFNLDMQMGTPPTPQEPMGQNWGFPTFGIRAEHLQRDVVHHMEKFYDAVRIDHAVAFFRVWEIPRHAVYAVMGHFSPSLPLTVEEIGRFGLSFRKSLFTRPFINDTVIDKLFGVHAQYVREHYLNQRAYHLYDLRPEVDTQVKVQALFQGSNDEDSQWICDGLMRLCANVLFLEDSYCKDTYHPRYEAWNTLAYQILSGEEREAFMRLYHHYYRERHPDFWRVLAEKRLNHVLAETRMLVCAENLGTMLPACVEPVFDRLRILSLDIQSLPKDGDQEFSRLSANAYRSVATISTHDMAPLRLWWEEDHGRTQRYYAAMLQKEGPAPRHLPAHLAEEIISRHLYCPSMLCLLSVQDWLAMDTDLRAKDVAEERINAPYNPYNQWKYRMNVTIEQLMAAEQYTKKLHTMIARSKRTE